MRIGRWSPCQSYPAKTLRKIMIMRPSTLQVLPDNNSADLLDGMRRNGDRGQLEDAMVCRDVVNGDPTGSPSPIKAQQRVEQ